MTFQRRQKRAFLRAWLIVGVAWSLVFGLGANAQPQIPCGQLLEPNATLKARIAEYISEIRSQNSYRFGPGWTDRVGLYSNYPLETLQKYVSMLDERRAEFSKRAALPPVIEPSIRVLQSYTRQLIARYPKTGTTYLEFLRLSEIYAHHFGFLDPSSKRRARAIRANTVGAKTWVKDKPAELQPLEVMILNNETHLESLLKIEDLTWNTYFENSDFTRRIDSKLKYFGRWLTPLVLIPTTANLGFDTILWAQAHGAGFLGVTDLPVDVDGRRMDPITFFGHDLNHNIGFEAKPAAGYWDDLMKELEPLKEESPRAYKITMAILFTHLHERFQDFGCANLIKNIYGQVERMKIRLKMPKSKIPHERLLLEIVRERLLSGEDLGATFGRTGVIVTSDELIAAGESLQGHLMKVCGSSDQKR